MFAVYVENMLVAAFQDYRDAINCLNAIEDCQAYIKMI